LPQHIIVAHRDPEKLNFVQKWREDWLNIWGDGKGPLQVTKSCKSEIYSHVSLMALKKDLGRLKSSSQGFNVKSVMIVPLLATGHVYGTITFGALSKRKFHKCDLSVAEEMGRQGGMAIANSRLYKIAKVAEANAAEGKELFRTLSETLPQLVWTAFPDGRLDYFNSRWEEYCGYKPKDNPRFWKSIIHPDHLEPMYKKWHHSLITGTLYEYILPIKDRNGNYVWHLSRGFPTKDTQGNVMKWFGACTNIDSQKREEGRIQKLQDLTSALSRAVTQNEIGDALLRRIVNLPGTKVAALGLCKLNGDKVELATAFYEPHKKKVQILLPKEVSLTDPDPLCLCIKGKKKIVLESKSATLSKFPRLRDIGSLCVLPLIFQSRTLGALAIHFDTEGKVSDETQAFLNAVIHLTSQALERARLFESELHLRHRAEENEQRLKFLALASTILSENLDHEKTLKNIVAHAVPYFCDGCFVDLVNDDGQIDRIAASYYDSKQEQILFDFVNAHENLYKSPTSQVLATGESLLMDLEEATNLEFVAQGRPDILEMVKSLNPKSIIMVRLGPKEKPIGVMSFFYKCFLPSFQQ